ncbi:MAG: IS1634 family transposase [Candidatus Omnitrophica bacterium]|nr:IS1634 family transposase [Candidatus Omnitrophota bacterium]
MYVRIKRVKNSKGELREYLLVVEGKRIQGKVRQRTIANLGRLDLIQNTQISDLLIDKLKDYTKILRLMDIAKTCCDWSKDYGVILVLKRLWEDLSLDQLFKIYLKKYKYKTNLSECILSLVISRLTSPGSEYHTFKWIQSVYEPKWEDFKLQHFYRALDFIYRHKSDLEKDLFFKMTNLFSQELDLIMFDTTSIKYWGEAEDIDILQYGYSKEKRGDLKQVIIGILMTKEGIPCGCEVFKGNTSDLKSFIHILEKLKEEYKIGKLIWVADRGMVSTENISKLNELNQQYILGIKMRQLNKERRDEFLSLKGMFPVSEDLYAKEVIIPYEGRYIICFNPKEQELERKKREFFKKVLEKKIETQTTKEWIIKNGYRKYIDITEGKIELNEKRLRAEYQFDGKWVLLTNTKLPSKEVALYYKDLWQIEASFRDLKDDLETSPIYHWTERRIIAHIFICFLSLLLKIAFNKRLKQIDKQACYSEVFAATNQIKAVKLTEGRKEIIFRTEFPPKANLAFKATGIAPPPRIISYKENPSVVSRQGEF